MKLHKDSHVDHNLTTRHLSLILSRFGDHQAFFAVTFELPPGYDPVPCGLHGPLVGDPPVPDSEVVHEPRGSRAWPSRIVHRDLKPSNMITVIAGPHDGERCVLFTAYGGPMAPQEPGDPGCKDPEASAKFWADHALSR